MPKSAYLTCLWPGLARLWWGGELRGLAAAVAFAVLLNFAAFFSAFPEFGVAEGYLIAAWVIVISWWGGAIHASLSEIPYLIGGSVKLSKASDLARAQVAYLKRDFVATESIIGKILTTQPADPVIRLLLAATYRQTGRIVEARGLLSSLQSEPAALAWQFEIQADLARLDRVEKAPPEESASAPEVESRPRVVEASLDDVTPKSSARRGAVRRAA
jgi:hypothetical protein